MHCWQRYKMKPRRPSPTPTIYAPIPLDREGLTLMGNPFPDLATLIHVQRYKSLDEGAMPQMNYDQLFDTTMDSSNRKMLKVVLDDAIRADQIFTSLMGDDVELRRCFIEDNALNVRDLNV